jgi:hypothetical protein
MFEFYETPLNQQVPKVYQEPCDKCAYVETLAAWSCDTPENHTNV